MVQHTYLNNGINGAALQYEGDVLLVQREVAERAEPGNDKVVFARVCAKEVGDHTGAAASTHERLESRQMRCSERLPLRACESVRVCSGAISCARARKPHDVPYEHGNENVARVYRSQSCEALLPRQPKS